MGTVEVTLHLERLSVERPHDPGERVRREGFLGLVARAAKRGGYRRGRRPVCRFTQGGATAGAGAAFEDCRGAAAEAGLSVEDVEQEADGRKREQPTTRRDRRDPSTVAARWWPAEERAADSDGSALFANLFRPLTQGLVRVGADPFLALP